MSSESNKYRSAPANPEFNSNDVRNQLEPFWKSTPRACYSICVIQLNGISKQYGSKILLEEASAFIGENSKIALIGPNGAGKSTLIKMILGHEIPDAGTIARTKNVAIGHLAQEVPKASDRTVLDEAMRLDGRREQLLASKGELESSFSEHSASEADLKRYGRITEELEHLDEYRLESRAKEILSGMGFRPRDFSRSLTEFSGGWLMRVALSRVLLTDPDLLLLDEPTNHLDLESLLWLEEFLREFHGAVLLVSHDTRFLNRVANEVFEVDQRKVNRYAGNLDSYAVQKAERLEILRAQYAGQQAKIAEIEAFVARFGAKATKARQAQSRLKQLEKMDRIELNETRATVRFRFPPAPHGGKEAITMDRVSISYGDKRIFSDLNWVIPRGSRVAIVGVNGAGKTTMLKLLSGALPPTAGAVKHGHQTKVGYYAQLQTESLDLRKTILEELQASAPETSPTQLRGIAGAFLFSGDAVDKRCSVLSGGEKARVALAKLLLVPTNFLILDEPTNHLDVDSRSVLLEALQDYDGTLVIVSHDREFISPLVTSVLEISPSESGRSSTATPLVCDYEEYLERKMNEVKETRRLSARSVEATQPSARSSHVSDSTARALHKTSFNQKRTWERERDKLESEITGLEKRQAALSETLSDVKTYENRELSLRCIEEQKRIQETLAVKLSRWEELCLLLG